MQRHLSIPRPNKAEKLEGIGLSFHNWDFYWKEDSCYEFSLAQVEQIEEATEEVHQLCLKAVEKIVNDRGLMDQMKIPAGFQEAIGQSWNRKDPSLYGRFDFCFDGTSTPIMLEYNADTPTSLLESAVAQWDWLQDLHPEKDQFNSLHEKLIERWKQVLKAGTKLKVASLSDNEEDWVCTHYLIETAIQAGFDASHMYIEDIAFGAEKGEVPGFVDQDLKPIEALFKLYPWEWMLEEEFGLNVIGSKTQFIEPLWKTVLSNKAILAMLWKFFPGSKYLVPAFIGGANGLTSYARKPIFSREGANVELVKAGRTLASGFDQGYGEEGYVYQQMVQMPRFVNKYPVIGSWVVGNEAAGMCIREDDGQITTNMSNFVPHFIKG